jgi:hypothetical protein
VQISEHALARHSTGLGTFRAGCPPGARLAAIPAGARKSRLALLGAAVPREGGPGRAPGGDAVRGGPRGRRRTGPERAAASARE